jgi:hypothetical protein
MVQYASIYLHVKLRMIHRLSGQAAHARGSPEQTSVNLIENQHPLSVVQFCPMHRNRSIEVGVMREFAP